MKVTSHFKIRFKATSRTRLLIPHFILFPPYAFPFAGAVDKIVLPEGIKEPSSVQAIMGIVDQLSNTGSDVDVTGIMSMAQTMMGGGTASAGGGAQMQSVSFFGCKGITGTNELEDV